MSQATAYEQYMLELVNAERAKVGAQPLAFNGDLNESAESHSDWMIATDTFSHTGASGSSPTQRMKDAGYSFTGSWASAENIAWASTRSPTGFQDEVKLLHTNLMNSAGHKANILNANFREVGIGFETGEYKGWDGAFVTENFARSGSKVFLTGVAFDDKDTDRSYDVGEALGGIAITAVSSSGAKYATTTQSAGGYSLALAAGTYTVTFTGGGITPVTKQVTIGTKNVKLDLVDPSASGTGTATSSPTTPTPTTETITGTSSGNTLKGTSGADVIKGYGGNDELYGYAGTDKIYGSTGNDKLYGSSGKDVLLGSSGDDYLVGGSGADSFRFRGKWGSDTIKDFQNGVDRLDLRSNGLSFKELSIAKIDADKDGRVDDVIIKADGHSITLLNEKVSLIGASDFLL
ncbi:CAP domain-containing protein [Microvirga roseola]|uniref:CAP domain-containing protein n=1 Tax=Microvirga roseola TaxID=2883126 RepID=UPI001E36F5B5|nr:CAP domain-containing protein [Microvirga roseola]